MRQREMTKKEVMPRFIVGWILYIITMPLALVLFPFVLLFKSAFESANNAAEAVFDWTERRWVDC